MSDNRWHIEGAFRDGSYRVRDDKGQYKSLSVAILEETSEIDRFTPEDLAETFEVDRQIIMEHLGHLREEGLVEQKQNNWTKPKDFDPHVSTEELMTEEQEWAYSDDDSIY